MRVWISLLWLGTACVAPPPPVEPDPEPVETAEIPCDEPTASWDRFHEEAFARGLAEPAATWQAVAALIARDLDGDGDVDLLYDHEGLGLALRLNDGRGYFGPAIVLPDTDRFVAEPVAADLDGDGVPEIVAVDETRVRSFSWGGRGLRGGDAVGRDGRCPLGDGVSWGRRRGRRPGPRAAGGGAVGGQRAAVGAGGVARVPRPRVALGG